MTVQATTRSPSAGSHVAVRDAAVGLTVAAAVGGAAEIALQRIAVPVSAHVALPGAEWLPAFGDFAAGATAALVVGAVAALAFALRRRAAVAAVLAAGLGATLVAVALPDRQRFGYLVVAAGLLVIPVLRARDLAWTAALGAAAVATVAGLWPLVSGGGVDEARTLAEIAVVAAPLIVATGIVRRQPVPAVAWAWAVAAGGLAAVAVTIRLDTVAMATVWALGITLALPAVAYVAAAAAAGLVVATWWADPARRIWIAGAVLLGVAGLQPAAVHHSLTALVALAVLSLPAGVLGGDEDEGAAL